MGTIRSIDSRRTAKNSNSVSYINNKNHDLNNLIKISLEEPSPHQLYSLAATCPNLRQLTITLPIDSIRVIEGICAIKSLRHLTYGPRPDIRKKSLSLLTSKLPRLQSLRSQKLQFDDQDVQSIATNFRNLSYLSLNNNKISDAGAQYIAKYLSNLNVLELSFNNLTISGYLELIEQLPKLETLRIQKTPTQNMHTLIEDAQELSVYLTERFYMRLPSSVPKLKKLIIDVQVSLRSGLIYISKLKELQQLQINFHPNDTSGIGSAFAELKMKRNMRKLKVAEHHLHPENWATRHQRNCKILSNTIQL